MRIKIKKIKRIRKEIDCKVINRKEDKAYAKTTGSMCQMKPQQKKSQILKMKIIIILIVCQIHLIMANQIYKRNKNRVISKTTNHNSLKIIHWTQL